MTLANILLRENYFLKSFVNSSPQEYDASPQDLVAQSRGIVLPSKLCLDQEEKENTKLVKGK